MTQTLVLFLPGPEVMPGDPVHWVLAGADGARLREGWAGAGDALAWTAGERPARTLALIPAHTVFAARLSAPARSEREAQQAAPYMIEDALASPLDTQTIACGPADAGGLRLIVAADAALVARWAALAAHLGVRPVHVLPDAALLTPEEGIALHLDAERIVWARAGQGPMMAGAAPASLAGDLIGELAQGHEALLASPAALEMCRQAGLDARPVPEPDFARLAGLMTTAEARAWPRLLGDALSARIDWTAMARPWARAAVLAVSAGALALAIVGGQAYWLDRRAAAYDSAAADVFTQAFPEVRRVVNPRAQIQRRLRALEGASGADRFVSLSARLASLLQGMPEMQVEALRFEAERGVLSVTARYREFSDFERLRAAAAELGLSVEDTGARQVDGGVVGDFQIGERS